MKFAEYLIEVASKDWDRMQTLINKNSDGAGVAKTIKDKTKAICGDDKAETLAEIYNRDKIDFNKKEQRKIGF